MSGGPRAGLEIPGGFHAGPGSGGALAVRGRPAGQGECRAGRVPSGETGLEPELGRGAGRASAGRGECQAGYRAGAGRGGCLGNRLGRG